MDAKRIVPVLHILEGRVVDPTNGSDLGLPSQWARRLEMEGADELLFVERGRGRRLRQSWLTAVAGSLFIPFALEAPFGDGAEVAEALEDGADKAVVPATGFRDFRLAGLGRSRLVAGLEAAWSGSGGWAGTLEAMADLGACGAGEICLAAGTLHLAELCSGAARLSLPVILRCAEPDLAAEALAHGADGIAFPASLMTTGAFKDLLAGAELLLRR